MSLTDIQVLLIAKINNRTAPTFEPPKYPRKGMAGWRPSPQQTTDKSLSAFRTRERSFENQAVAPDEAESTANFFEALDEIDELLYGRTFAIEYEDAKGTESRRRITVKRVKESGGKTQLYAICHESNALRCFRLDRVLAIIDRYGEVFEPASEYFKSQFATDISALLEGVNTPRFPSKKASRKYIAPGISLLGTLAHADGFLHQDEVEAIIQFADEVSMEKGHALTSNDCEALQKDIAAFVTPDALSIRAAMNWIQRNQQGKIFARYSRIVADADGILTPDETALLLELATELDH